MIVYHIDRLKSLKEGQTIEFLHPPIEPEVLRNLAIDRYPEGLSHHGDFYFGRMISKDFVSDSILENILEYERLLYFPERPSRFQSIFATNSIDQMNYWIQSNSFREWDFNICELEINHSNYALLDSSWYGFDVKAPSFLTTSYKAKNYWKGEITDNPKYELVVKLPVVVRKCTSKSQYIID